MWIILAIVLIVAIAYGIKVALSVAAVIAVCIVLWWAFLALGILFAIGSKFK